MKVVIYIGKKRISKKASKAANIKRKQLYNVRSLCLLILFSLCFLLLLIRIGYIQFAKGPEYKEDAYKQQTTSQVIASKRGTIYDSTGKKLAISSDVDTVSINNGQVFYTDGTAVSKEKLATRFR